LPPTASRGIFLFESPGPPRPRTSVCRAARRAAKKIGAFYKSPPSKTIFFVDRVPSPPLAIKLHINRPQQAHKCPLIDKSTEKAQKLLVHTKNFSA